MALKVNSYDSWQDHKDKLAIDTIMAYNNPFCVVAWALMDSNNNMFHKPGEDYCCAPLNRHPRTDTRDIYITLLKNTPYAREWWKNVLDPDTSPWHRVLTDVEVFENKNVDESNCVYRLGINKDTQFRDVVNLMIATRQASEYSFKVKPFIEMLPLIKEKVPDVTFAEALACYSLYSRPGYYYTVPTTFAGGHGFLSGGGQSSLTRLAKRMPISNPNKLFRSNDTYNPSDSIWSNGKEYAALVNAIHEFGVAPEPERVSSFFKQREVQAYAYPPPATKKVNVEDLIKILRSIKVEELTDKGAGVYDY